MCIIVYKPQEAAFPKKKDIKRLFEQNPDGGGFMYADADGVHGYKGFMAFGDYWRAITRARAGRESLPWAFHMRITTHGGTRPRMCHPFPLSSSVKRLTRCEWTADVGVMHNGIISMTDYARDISDTAEFIRTYLRPLWDVSGGAEWARELVTEAISGSRLLVMERDNVALLGDWFEDGGLFYSNDGYKRPRRPAWYEYSAADYYGYSRDGGAIDWRRYLEGYEIDDETGRLMPC